MCDHYLVERHAYAIAQKAYSEKKRRSNSPSIVTLTDGKFVRLPHETVLLRPSARVSLSLTVPKSLQDGRSSFSLDIADGSVYLTNQRIIYLPSNPTSEFKSFSAPILNFEDSYISSPWFGSWYWAATVKPEDRSDPHSIPADIPRVSIKLSFNEGGHNEFRACFEDLKERLHHARELQRELASLDDGLPAYEEGAGATMGPPPAYEE